MSRRPGASSSSASIHILQDGEIVKGVVEGIHGGIASVVVGEDRELWDFPLEMLPDTIDVDSVLVLERQGRRLRFVELDPVAEVVRGRPFDLRLRRTARKVPYMRLEADA
jgi:hypothetical protein